jgi:hypothetical protein
LAAELAVLALPALLAEVVLVAEHALVANPLDFSPQRGARVKGLAKCSASFLPTGQHSSLPMGQHSSLAKDRHFAE